VIFSEWRHSLRIVRHLCPRQVELAQLLSFFESGGDPDATVPVLETVCRVASHRATSRRTRARVDRDRTRPATPPIPAVPRDTTATRVSDRPRSGDGRTRDASFGVVPGGSLSWSR